MDRQSLVRVAGALPVFPLSGAVLLPGQVLPLHVFEPRYRELVSFCLEGERLLGIATLQPGYEADYHGAPPIHRPIGIGEIVGHQGLPDGRSNILVEYRGRGELVDELEEDRAFRVVKVELLDEVEGPATSEVSSLRRLVLQLAARAPEAAEELMALDDTRIVDGLARRILLGSEERLAYLAAEDLAARARLVQGHLAGLLTKVPAAEA